MLQVAKFKGSRGPKNGDHIQFAGVPGVYLVHKVEAELITCRRVRNTKNKP